MEAPTDVVVTSGTQFGVDGNNAALVIDLQGILFHLPPGGGTASPLTGPTDDVRRPRISPDGRWVVYQTFASGVWDIGLARIDGRDRRLLTSGPHDHRDPAWSRDGRSIWFTSDRTGNYDLWSIDIETGTTMQRTRDPADDYGPTVSAAGLAFVSERSGAPALYFLEKPSDAFPTPGTPLPVKKIAGAPGGRLHPPRLSPDGRRIAYVRAVARNAFPGVALNQLVVTEVRSGETRVLSADGADVFGAAPAWLDDDSLIYTADGGIRRVDVDTGVSGEIPFRVALTVKRSVFTPRVPVVFSSDEKPALGIVDPVALPDGKLVFTALGDLWVLDADGELTQLTDDAFVERDVSVSGDGETLAYISDRDGEMGIRVSDISASFSSRGPRYPTFSPDGQSLAYLEVGPRGMKDFTLRVLDLATGKSRRMRSSPQVWPGRIAWSADGSHVTVAELAILSARFGDGANRLVRINVADDTASIEALPDGLTPDFGPVASRDGSQLALVIDGALWRVPVAADGRLAGAPVLVLDALVESPAWSWDGRAITVLTNRGLETVVVESGERRVRNPPLSWSPAAASGTRVVHAGRLFDGNSITYRKDVDIVIDGARIVAVEPHRERSDDENIEFIDAGDKTVLPGLVDHHVHFEPHKGEWVGRALLGFGVTTVVEPGGLAYESREIMEAWASGRRVGPRLVFAGPQLDGSRRHFHFAAHINSDRRLEWELDRGERLGYGLIKTYTRLPPARQKLAVELAHARGLPVTAHAAYRNLGFGGDRIEHLRGSSRLAYSPKQSELLNTYADVEEIIVQSGGSVTPTIVAGGGFFDFAWRHPEIFDNPQYVALWPGPYRQGLAGFTRVVSKNRILVERGLTNARATVKRLHERGVRIVAGTDSPIFPYGLALIIELANYVDAGLTPAEALQTATTHAAAELGADQEIGRIQPGLLADLVIIDGDPLTDITDLLNVSGVMVNGRYFTLEELIGLIAPGTTP